MSRARSPAAGVLSRIDEAVKREAKPIIANGELSSKVSWNSVSRPLATSWSRTVLSPSKVAKTSVSALRSVSRLRAMYPAPPQAQQAFGQQPPPQAFPPPPPPLPQPYSGGANPMTPQDEKTTGMAAHGVTLAATVLSGGTLGFLCALVMYLVFRDRGPFVRHHSANALNVQIIAGIVMLISIPLMFVLVGFLTFAAAWVFAVIVHIVGAVKANNGEWWTPPMTPQFVK